MEAEALRRWLVNRVAAEAGIPAAEVDVDDAFSYFGIESAAAVTIAGELEALLGRPLEPTVLFDQPSISALVAHLLEPASAPSRPAAPRPTVDEIAIVGLACRFPGAASVADFWDLLVAGRDEVGTVPPGRWPEDRPGPDAGGSRHGAFLDAVEDFDAEFFRIPKEEARRMDPQQRLLLEVSWEAFEDAGRPAGELRGSTTGVFVGISQNEYGRRQLHEPTGASALTPTGNALSVAANRLSYFYDIRGPSIAVDTACSSSLVAAHLAISALRQGDCDQALVCGVNLLLEPEISEALERAGMLAPDGRCKAFSAQANGYVRGEGCAAVVLKPLASAVADGDRIYAVVLGSAVNHDGRTNGLTAPSVNAQEDVLRAAAHDAGVDPADVQYVECHGTGTFLGDPIEARALGAVFGRDRPLDAPCLIGSVKTNIGHLESAAGIAGLLKATLAIHHGQLPGNLHFGEPNPSISFGELGLDVVGEARPWPRPDSRLVAGVSSFGFGGSNAHLVLAAPDTPPTVTAEAAPPYLLPVSAKTAPALKAAAAALADHLDAVPESALPDLAHTAAVRRTHHPVRLAVVGETADELAARLRAVRPRDEAPGRGTSEVAFVFSGQGSQWVGMACGLLASNAVFRSTIHRCDEVVAEGFGWSIVDVLTDESRGAELERTELAQPALFAVQAGLVAVLRSFGVIPAAVVGHSVGEVAAAYAAGVVSLADGARLAALRGASMADTIDRGRMLAIGASEAKVTELLERFNGLSLAAVNGPNAVVVAGDDDLLDAVRDICADEEWFNRLLPVRYAFHSKAMDAAATALPPAVAGIAWSTPTTRVYSTVLGRAVGTEMGDPRYWRDNVRETVRFKTAVEALLDDGIDSIVELGADAVLQTPLRQITQARGDVPTFATLRRGHDDWRSLLETAAGLYGAGVDLAWPRLAPRGRVTAAPHYVWQRERLWVDRPARSLAGRRSAHPLLGTRLDVAPTDGLTVWQADLSTTAAPFLADHRVLDTAVMPATGYLEILFAAARAVGFTGPLTAEDVAISAFLPLDEQPRRVQTTLRDLGGDVDVRIHSRGDDGSWVLHAAGRVRRAVDDAPVFTVTDALTRCLEQLPQAPFYRLLGERGLGYGPAFRSLSDVWRRDGEAVGTLQPGAPGFELDPRVLDGGLQLVAAAALLGSAGGGDLRVPTAMASVTCWSDTVGTPLRARAELRRDPSEEDERADVELVGPDGRAVVALRGVRLQRLGQRETRVGTERHVWLYDTTWAPADLPSAGIGAPGRVLALTDGGDSATAAVEELRRAGAEVVVASPRREFERSGDLSWVVDPGSRDHLDRLVAEVGRVDCVVYLCTSGPPSQAATPPERARHLTSSLVALVQALSFGGAGPTPPLWVVTRGTQAVIDATDVADPFAAALWGMARVVPFENPALQCRCVDLDPAGGGEDALVAELSEPTNDAQVAYRGAARFVHRLVPVDAPGGASAMPLRLDPSGAYLVTGGFGGLGRFVATWLADRGARHVALLGRQGATADAQATVADLQRRGVEVTELRCDVSSADEVQAALAAIAASPMPLRGIVHAAGVLADGPLLRIAESDVGAVFDSKVDGAWWLTEAAPDTVEWVVFFSSAASVLGSPGQGNYCAANAFLDQYARHLRARGRTACAVNWGAWAKQGMAAEVVVDGSLRAAYTALQPEDGLGALDLVIGQARAQTVVLPFDLRNLLQFFPTGLGLPFFDVIQTEEAARLRSIGLGSHASSRPPLDREYVPPSNPIEQEIAGIWQASLGIDKVGIHDGFFELGGDSVFGNQIVVEVNRVLGVTIDADRAFEDFTVANLARLAEESILARLDEMSEEEAQRLLSHGSE